jgi:hypothetical protein
MPRQRKSNIVTVDRINELLSFDKETGVFRWRKVHPRSSIRVGDVAGCVDKRCGYIKIKIDRVSYQAHYLAWAVTNGVYPSRLITQLNGDRTDCRPRNLEMKTDYRDGIDANVVRGLLNYDQETGIFTWKVNRSRTAKLGEVAGNIDILDGYVRISINGTLCKGHRLAWLHVYGEWPNGEIDHIHGIRHDNRISQLREVDDLGTAQNRGIGKANNSGRVGVSYLPKTNKYTAFIRANGVQYHLGTFDTFDEARSVRRQKEAEFFGEYARDHGDAE